MSDHGSHIEQVTEPHSPVRGDWPERIGDYRIIREVGRGGMGVVYEAEQISLGRRVALKILPQNKQAGEGIRIRFQREARAAAKMHHTNIVPVFEVGQEGDCFFYAMQLINGRALDAVIKNWKKIEDPTLVSDGNTGQSSDGDTTLFTPDGFNDSQSNFYQQIAKIAHQASEALAYAHNRGIIHRDIKPSNLLLDDEGVVWITDFGLAKSDEEEATLTQSGDFLGTLRYMSPERFRGICDVQADVYALGATVYELLLQKPIVESADRIRLIYMINNVDPVSPRALDPRIPRDLETILLKSIDKDPQRRYATANDLAEDLRRFLHHEPIQARRNSALDRWKKWARRHPATAALYVLIPVMLVLAFLGGGATWLWQRAESAKTSERASRKLAEQSKNQAEIDRDAANLEREKARIAQVAAESARIATLKANEEAEKSLYVNRVVRAQFEWSNNRVAQAERLLDECPNHLRDWEWYYLHQLCNSELFTLNGHTTGVRRLAFSPDGKRLVSGSGGPDNQLIVWDPKTGEKLETYDGGRGLVFDLCFSPDGKWVARAGYGHPSLKIINTETGEVVHTLRNQMRISFSHDGKRFVTVSGDKTTTVWDSASGQPLQSFQHSGGVVNATFSPDGKWIASTNKYNVVLLDSMTGDQKWSGQGHSESIHSVRFSPDGSQIVSGSMDRTLKLWDTNTGTEIATFRGHLDTVSSACFSPDGKQIASSSLDTTVRLWDVQTGLELRRYRGHTSPIVDVAYSPDGQRIASASGDKTVKVWDASRAQETQDISIPRNGIYSMCFSADNKQLAGGGVGSVRIWSTQDLHELNVVRSTGRIDAVSYSSHGALLASASSELILWDAKTGRRIHQFEGHKRGGAWDACLSQDGKWLASVGIDDGTVKVWSTQTGEIAQTLDCQQKSVIYVRFSPAGNYIASAGHRPNAVRIWNAANGELVNTIELNGTPQSMQFSPDGRWLALGKSSTVTLFDVKTGEEIYSRKGHIGRVTCIDFSPDGRRLVSGGQDRTIRIWDVESGEQTAVLTGHQRAINDVCFSPNGQQLASSDGDIRRPGAVKLWEAPGYSPKR